MNRRLIEMTRKRETKIPHAAERRPLLNALGSPTLAWLIAGLLGTGLTALLGIGFIGMNRENTPTTVVLFSDSVYAPYSQIALLEGAASNRWDDLAARWTNDSEAVIGGHGLAVAAESDGDIDVQVVLGATEFQGDFIAECELEVGGAGLDLSNASVEFPVQIPPGRVSIRAYASGPRLARNHITFHLSRD
jgi:hypothetical protein